MSQQTVVQVGAFTNETRDAINSNFTELYATQVGGTLASGKVLVGSAGDVATAVDMSGDATIDNTGAVDIAAGVANQKIVVDGAGDAARVMAAGFATLDGTNPTTVTILGGVFALVGMSAVLVSDDISTETAYVTVTAGAGNNSFSLYAWKKDGSASTGTEKVAWVAYGYPD